MSQSYETLAVSVQDGVETITLNRPDRMNALTPRLLQELACECTGAAHNSEVRALVITGAGRGFCAGADLGRGLEKSILEMLEEYYHPAILSLVQCSKPVIAAVNGPAAGAGMSLALACDMRLMAQDAFFSTAFTKIGLTMDAGGSYFLPRLVGLGRAFELGYSARQVLPDEAVRLGLAEEVKPTEELLGYAQAVATQLAQGATRAYGLLKQCLHSAHSNNLPQHLILEGASQQRASESADFKEGVQAFLEKRPAKFTGS